MDARQAAREAGLVGQPEPAPGLVRGRLGGNEDRVLRALVAHAGQLAVGVPVEPAPVGIRRVQPESGGGQSAAVGGHDVPAGPSQHDRVLGRDRVEVEPVRVAALGQSRLVVSAAADPRARRRPGDLPPQVFDDGSDGLHPRRLEVHRLLGVAQPRQMVMGVDEPRHQRAAAQIDSLRPGIGEGTCIVIRADRQDPISQDRDGLGNGV